MLTIAMYHYVRDLAGSPFPRIKGRTVDEFRGQLEYLASHYTVVRMENVLAALDRAGELPDNAALLTFDDGFRDHYDNVLPLLAERGWQGSFYAPVRPVCDRVVLDVHKLHFVLATVEDPQRIVREIFAALERWGATENLPSADAYWRRLAHASRFDPPEIIFAKRMLQRELPEHLRAELTGRLFQRFVTADERAFADELYLSPAQLRAMHEAGMHIGHHGVSHHWLTALNPGQREREIDEGLAFLRSIGVDPRQWTLCYPYGDHDAALRELLRTRGCALGFTTEVAVADLREHDPLALPRLDTNDLPPTPGARQHESQSVGAPSKQR